MILIIAERGDPSTQHILDWLAHYKADYTHVSDKESMITFKSLSLSTNEYDTVIEVDDKVINFNEVSAYFWRRGFLHYCFKNMNHQLADTGDIHFDKLVSEHLYREKDQLLKNLYFQLENIPNKLGSYLFHEENKLDVLFLAKRIGLDIPRTLVTSKKSDLVRFKKECGNIISKAISQTFTARVSETESYSHLTASISQEDIEKQEATFFPTLVQEQLEKKYELRIFYLNGKCYSMAIFSQADDQTKVDFRNYNDEKPNRTVPFELPEPIADKIGVLMNALHLDNGSIDMVVTKENRYVFLEVNPVGQFGMVSYPCNYYLEKKMAKLLIAN